ncbi:MAG: cytosine permease, partial [Flavobacteriaceae bacterium]|nr:cytosine permease [Flavobacteriaceae bacterium]
PIVIAVSMFGLTIATLSTNIAANVVAPANSFANIMPKKISFKMGGYITGIIGILIFPWKLIADPEGYIFRWLIAYSALLGSLAGIMICDYYIVRKTKFDLAELFKVNGKFKGWNKPAWIAFVISILPVIPGFLVVVGIYEAGYFPQFLVNLYSYAWFVTFGISFLIYWMIMKKIINKI